MAHSVFRSCTWQKKFTCVYIQGNRDFKYPYMVTMYNTINKTVSCEICDCRWEFLNSPAEISLLHKIIPCVRKVVVHLCYGT
jgi:hypothetical protein